MPTIDDLRAVLVAREEYAGDPNTVLHRLAEPPRRRLPAPAIAAAATVALAVGVVGLANSVDSTTTQPGSGSSPHPLVWSFRMDPVTGFTLTRVAVTATSQLVKVVSASGDGPRGLVTLYAPGVQPKELRTGTPTTVDGQPGYFVAGTTPGTSTTDMAAAWNDPDSFARLRWQYDDGAWAEVIGTFGYQPDSASYDNDAALSTERRLAAAVQLPDGSAVTMPLALRDLPDDLIPVAASPAAPQICIEYAPGNAVPAAGDESVTSTVLTACRIVTGSVDVRHDFGDDRLTRDLGDGTTLVLEVDSGHDGEISADGLRAIADDANTSPSLSEPSTWLPVS